MRTDPAELWWGRLSRLKIDTVSKAPHKPLLLLVVLELAEEGQLATDLLPLTPELAFRFCAYWSVVAARRKQPPDVRFPFYHLRSDGFWSPLTAGGVPAGNRLEARVARLDPEFAALARDVAWGEQARRILIARYFPAAERPDLYTLAGLPVPSDEQIAADAAYQGPKEGQKKGREARFRLTVVAAYGYTCALTGYRLTTIAGTSIVDAAHIHQFADSRNNDPQNGIALCKNAHWLFDNGLWSLTDDCKVIVAVGRFAEDSPDQRSLGDYHGQQLRLPLDQAPWPDPTHLA